MLGAASIVSSLFDRRGYFAHSCARAWSWLILKTTGVRVVSKGLERVVPGTTYVFVSNHQSIYDTPVIFASLPFQLRIIAKTSLARFPVLGWHLKRGGHLFVDRQHPDRAGILKRWRALVSEGLSLLIFAEGTRSGDGHVARFKAGSFLLAIEAGLPIVPLAVINTRQVMPKGRLRTEPADVRSSCTIPSSRRRSRRRRRKTPRRWRIASTPSLRSLSRHCRMTELKNRRPVSSGDKSPDVNGGSCVSTLSVVASIVILQCSIAMYVTAIIAAGGRGARIGAERPKQLLAIGRSALLERSVGAFLGASVDRRNRGGVAPRYPAGAAALSVRRRQAAPACRGRPAPPGFGLERVSGGRCESDLILVHDAARPFVSADLIARTIDAAAAHGAAIAAVPVRDTVKRVLEADGRRVITETIPRDTIFLAQTPQGFRREVLASALALGQAGSEATDEASLAERAGHTVHVVMGEPGNIKITTVHDLEDARQRAAPGEDRAGGHGLRSAPPGGGSRADPGWRGGAVRSRRCSATRTPT